MPLSLKICNFHTFQNLQATLVPIHRCSNLSHTLYIKTQHIPAHQHQFPLLLIIYSKSVECTRGCSQPQSRCGMAPRDTLILCRCCGDVHTWTRSAGSPDGRQSSGEFGADRTWIPRSVSVVNGLVERRQSGPNNQCLAV